MLHRYEVDWDANGFDEDALSELAEFLLRLLYSFLVDNGNAPRDPHDLRVFLARWVGPAVIYPRFAGALDSVAKVSAPKRTRRRSAS